MNRIKSIIWREFRDTVLTKSFLIGAVLTPILIAIGIPLLAFLFAPNSTPLEGQVIILGGNEKIIQSMSNNIKKVNLDLEELNKSGKVPEWMVTLTKKNTQDTPQTLVEINTSSKTREVLLKEVEDGGLVALIEIPKNILTEMTTSVSTNSNLLENELQSIEGDSTTNAIDPKILITLRTGTPPRHTSQLKKAIQKSIIENRIELVGYDQEMIRFLTTPPPIETLRRVEGRTEQENAELKKMVPLVFMMLLWIATITGANALMMNTIEEKASMLVEVLLSAVTPFQLMTGKIFAQGLVSSLFLITYGGLGLIGLLALNQLGLITLSQILLTSLFFVIAYLSVAGVLAGIGSAVSDIRDAQNLVGPAMVLLMLPFFVWPAISEQPNSGFSIVTSYIPLLSPFVMVIRITASTEIIPAFQIVSSFIWGITCTCGILWASSRIFRTAILLQGKPPSIITMIKWAIRG